MYPISADKGLSYHVDPVFSRLAHDELSRLLAAVPAMPDTLVELEAVLGLPTVDLNAVCNTLRTDLGLTLRALQFAPVPLEPRFGTLQQCVLEAGIQCLRVMGQTMPALALSYRDPKLHSALQSLWQHSRSTAVAAERIAANADGADPEKVYLAGLLHDLLVLPAVLDSSMPSSSAANDQMDFRKLVLAWTIPPYAIESVETRGIACRCLGPIASIVAAAHEQVSNSD
jgi:HD-like signal output (HDOD) protein